MFINRDRKRFSVERSKDEHRISFKHLRKNSRRLVKPFWWIVLLLIVVLAVMYYLNMVMK